MDLISEMLFIYSGIPIVCCAHTTVQLILTAIFSRRS